MYEQVKSSIGPNEVKQPTLEQSVGVFWEETKILEEAFAILRSRLEKFKRPNSMVNSACLQNAAEIAETRSPIHVEIDKMADFVRSFRYEVGQQGELIDA